MDIEVRDGEILQGEVTRAAGLDRHTGLLIRARSAWARPTRASVERVLDQPVCSAVDSDVITSLGIDSAVRVEIRGLPNRIGFKAERDRIPARSAALKS